jgi:hypothetical protein
MLAKRLGLLRNGETACPDRGNVFAGHAHTPFTKRQHRARDPKPP